MTIPTAHKPQIVRPGPEPTHDDAEGGKRWHYLHLDGRKMDPPSFIYEHVAGGFGGECAYHIYPDGFFALGPATMDAVVARIEHELGARNIEVIDPPPWWAEAQAVRAALPKSARLAGPSPGVADPWLVCQNTPEGRAIGSWARSPAAALRSAVESWNLQAQEAPKVAGPFLGALMAYGYSPDPVGMDEAMERAGVKGRKRVPEEPEDMVAARLIRIALPDNIRLVEHRGDTANGWQIYQNWSRGEPVSPLSATPGEALRGFLMRLGWLQRGVNEAEAVRAVLPGSFRLDGPCPDTDKPWMIAGVVPDGQASPIIGGQATSPLKALASAIVEWIESAKLNRDQHLAALHRLEELTAPGPLVVAQQFDPSTLRLAVTLADGTRIEASTGPKPEK